MSSSPHPVVKPLSASKRAAATLAYLLGSTLMSTWRPVWKLHPEVASHSGPAIWCIWHNRLAISMLVYTKLPVARSSAGLVALISASQDGGLLAHVLKKFKVVPVRGSSSRRGAQALREAISYSEKGYSVAITPDGPRGPKYHLHEGILTLAQLTGHPIFPVASYTKCKACLKSWDKFQVPLPFARIDFIAAAPIRVPRESTEEDIQKIRHELLTAMNAITKD